MPNGPMERFLTRRSVAVLTGSLAFFVTYWYIRRQRSLKWSASESRNKKVTAKSCDQESFDVRKDSMASSKENLIASEVKQNDDTADMMLSDSVRDAGLESKFDRKRSEVVLVAELDNMIDANDISVLEVPINSLREPKKDPVYSLPHSNKVLVADKEEALESSSVRKESGVDVENIYNTKKYDCAINEQICDSNIMDYRSPNTPSSEVQFFNW
uniref:A-kinase anchor protein 1, mitochondrial n=1 Tax=Elaeophora elaphi TaxID=1147741 RepID=A0A0R3RT53_9BILA